MHLVNDDERWIMRFGSAENMLLRHRKLLAIHSPTLTKLCCLPILSQQSPLHRQSLGEDTGLELRGLVLEYTEEAVGVYRQVGHFSCALDVFRDHTKCEPNVAIPLTDQWPLRKQYSPEEGFAISII